MEYTYPDYYKQFKCIADECEDTCCAGWQIVVDEASLDKYKSISDENDFKERMVQSVDWDEGVFKQDKDKRCAFLNKSNLCDLYTALGEKALCHTCTSYPRHTEEYEGLREVTLSLSCPEVSRIVLGKEDRATFYTLEDDKEDDFEEFDVLMFSILQDIRDFMLEIIQDRNKTIKDRMTIVWHIAEELQELIDNDEMFLVEEVIEEYKNNPETLEVKECKCSYKLALDIFKKLYRLEVLNEQWEKDVDRAAINLYGQGENYYHDISDEFNRWLCENMKNWQIVSEQIIVYFISTYMCGAVYDGWLSSKVKMSVTSVFYIKEMLKSLWIMNSKKLTFDDVVNITYKFSRELEHSDINLEEIEECMNEI